MKKGDVLSVAQLAAIMGAKQTSNLIPLCHPLMLTKVEVHCHLVDDESLAFTTDTHNKELKLRLRLRQRANRCGNGGPYGCSSGPSYGI